MIILPRRLRHPQRGFFLNPYRFGVYTTAARDYDGSTNYGIRGADLTGIADSKVGTFSIWWRQDLSPITEILFDSSGGKFRFSLSSSRQPILNVRNAASSIIINKTPTSGVALSTWHQLMASWDLAATTCHYYLNGSVPSLSVDTVTNDTIDYTAGNYSIGGAVSGPGSNKFDGCISEVFFHTSYIDLSDSNNRLKFRTAGGKPANLGANGSTPLGVQPLGYWKNGDPENNLGTGGNMTYNGSVVACASSPSS